MAIDPERPTDSSFVSIEKNAMNTIRDTAATEAGVGNEERQHVVEGCED